MKALTNPLSDTTRTAIKYFAQNNLSSIKQRRGNLPENEYGRGIVEMHRFLEDQPFIALQFLTQNEISIEQIVSGLVAAKQHYPQIQDDQMFKGLVREAYSSIDSYQALQTLAEIAKWAEVGDVELHGRLSNEAVDAIDLIKFRFVTEHSGPHGLGTKSDSAKELKLQRAIEFLTDALAGSALANDGKSLEREDRIKKGFIQRLHGIIGVNEVERAFSEIKARFSEVIKSENGYSQSSPTSQLEASSRQSRCSNSPNMIPRGSL